MADLRSALAVPRPKVSVPRRIDRALERPRLLQNLAAETTWATHGPDVLLACAPAGYGKTTMLAELTEERRAHGVPVAWVTCTRDDDGWTLWNAVLVAVREVTGPPAGLLATLDAPTGPSDPAFVADLIAAVREEAPGLVLVLDDAHEVRDADAVEGLRHLVEWADGSLRVVLGCRFEPPIGLHRLRLSGRLHEVRAADLAFTPGEADEFWSRHDIDLTAASRATLHVLTEGWPAGLRLAALSLEGGGDAESFVTQFSGADRPVADYLAGEVLIRLPDDEVSFLLRSSIVEQLSVDLAAVLTGRPDAAAVLDDLAQRNALVMPLDRQGAWFRYHALLRSYLLAALTRRDPAERARLHALAAQWFLGQDQPLAALEHASDSGDSALVDRVLRDTGLGLLLAGAGAAVRRSIARLPAPARGTAAVLVHRALLAVDDGDLVEADEALAELAAVPDDASDARLTSLRRAASLHRARLAADLAGARASGLVAAAGSSNLPPDLDPDVRLLVLADRGALRLFEGDDEGARRDLHRAAKLARTAGLASIQLYCKNLIAGAYVAQNDLVEGRRAAERAIAFATERGWGRSPTMAYAYVLAGWTSFQALHPQEAATWAATAIDVLDTTVDVEVEGSARSLEAIIAFDEPSERRAALGRLERVTAWRTERGGSPAITAAAAPHELRMCLGLGEWRLAEQAVVRAENRLGPGGDAAVLQAQLASARGRPSDARRLLEPVLRGGLEPRRATALTTAWLLDALLAARSDRTPAATESLLTALRVAAPTGVGRPFLDAGTEVHALLAGLRGRAGHVEPFLEQVLTGIDDVLAWQASPGGAGRGHGAEHEPPTSAPAGGWLTERELVVLRDLPSMMTLGEVADAQGISLNTVKTHVRSIYAKLGVGTRREAIAAARALGLL
ncbi:AAA family ATPase [Fodinibacter luteus]|uniref:AAA family ATPase n=1 Tax=Fodinibacter luteus TaxID=552064 RepID=UPI0031E9C708